MNPAMDLVERVCIEHTADMILSGEWVYNFETQQIAVSARASSEFCDQARQSLIDLLMEQR